MDQKEGWDQAGAILGTIWDQVPFSGAPGTQVMGEAGRDQTMKGLKYQAEDPAFCLEVAGSRHMFGAGVGCGRVTGGWTGGSGGGQVSGVMASRTRGLLG